MGNTDTNNLNKEHTFIRENTRDSKRSTPSMTSTTRPLRALLSIARMNSHDSFCSLVDTDI